jgi:hypothetical protein
MPINDRVMNRPGRNGGACPPTRLIAARGQAGPIEAKRVWAVDVSRHDRPRRSRPRFLCATGRGGVVSTPRAPGAAAALSQHFTPLRVKTRLEEIGNKVIENGPGFTSYRYDERSDNYCQSLINGMHQRLVPGKDLRSGPAAPRCCEAARIPSPRPGELCSRSRALTHSYKPAAHRRPRSSRCRAACAAHIRRLEEESCHSLS